jgi:hypothetical protein
MIRCNGLWFHDPYLVASFISETRIFQYVKDEFVDVAETFAIQTNSDTVYIGQEKGRWVQIVSHGIYVFEGKLLGNCPILIKLVTEWISSTKISHGIIYGEMIVIASQCTLQLLKLDQKQVHLQHSIKFNHEISCVNILDIDSFGLVIACGTYEPNVVILDDAFSTLLNFALGIF